MPLGMQYFDKKRLVIADKFCVKKIQDISL